MYSFTRTNQCFFSSPTNYHEMTLKCKRFNICVSVFCGCLTLLKRDICQLESDGALDPIRKWTVGTSSRSWWCQRFWPNGSAEQRFIWFDNLENKSDLSVCLLCRRSIFGNNRMCFSLQLKWAFGSRPLGYESCPIATAISHRYQLWFNDIRRHGSVLPTILSSNYSRFTQFH